MAASHLSDPMSKINASKFYFEYKGHTVSDLTQFRTITLAERPHKPIIYLAGDSSLDNKHWFSKTVEDTSLEVPSIYSSTLEPPRPKLDVAFWMNHLLGERATCINTAIEESMLCERDHTLLPQDEFIRDNIRAEDVLIVSVGANDVALRPTAMTIFNMLRLAWCTRRKDLENGSAWALTYFNNMFGAKVQDYVARMTAKTKPRAVVVCMIYFPLETQFGQKSWADPKLWALGYESDPGQLQAAIRAIYKVATQTIKVEGTQIVPCALYEVLDGKTPDDYTQRVEPNEEGGRKMAVKFVELLDGVLGEPGAGSPST